MPLRRSGTDEQRRLDASLARRADWTLTLHEDVDLDDLPPADRQEWEQLLQQANALVQAAYNGVRLEGAEIYVTASPCFNCFKLIANAGITTIYYGEFYRDERIFTISEQLGLELSHLPIEEGSK